MKRVLWKALLCTMASAMLLGWVACAPVNPTTYSAELTWVPAKPLPERPATLKVVIKDQDGNVLGGVPVSVTATSSNGTSFSEELKEEGGGFGKQLTFKEDSQWELSFSFTLKEKTYSVVELVKVTCNGGQGSGDACCAASNCGSGLSCVYGTCQAQKAADGNPCFLADGCASGVCAEGKCATPTCQDGILNGQETDMDCGGSCGPCANTKKCGGNGDCQSGNCVSGSCIEIPKGPLLGPVARERAAWNTVVSLNRKTSDLAFHNERTEELWVVHPETDSLNIVTKPGEDDMKVRFVPDRSEHFMEEVQAISFSDNKTFGTCGDSRNTYGGRTQANDFMGPVLWDSGYDLLNKVVRSFHEVHLDMLHSSPQCMGIAAETQSKYFVFNGLAGTIDWYDFRDPHVPGGDDHSDGVKRRFSEVQVKRVADVPSNLVYVKETKWLYIADSGNGRILRINVADATQTQRLPSPLGDGTLWDTKGVKIVEVVKPGGELKTPSGLDVYDGFIYVSDYATGKIHAYDMDGTLVNTKDTGLGPNRLGGLTVGPDKRLYVVDRQGKIIRINP